MEQHTRDAPRADTLEAAFRAYPGFENIPPERMRWVVHGAWNFDREGWKRRFEQWNPEAAEQIRGLRRLTDAVIEYIDAGNIGLVAERALHKAGFSIEGEEDGPESLELVALLLRSVRDVPLAARGQPKKERARQAAIWAAKVVERQTRKRPTVTTDPMTNKRGGAFVTLIKRVFDILDIKASPVEMAREACEHVKLHPRPALTEPDA